MSTEDLCEDWTLNRWKKVLTELLNIVDKELEESCVQLSTKL